MPKNTRIIPNAPVARILQSVGARRASHEAISALADVLEDMAKKMADKSFEIAKHTGRKTIQREDVKIASKQF
jgi:histone H3/H4